MERQPRLGALGAVEYRGHTLHLPPQLYRVFARLAQGPATPDDIAEAIGSGPVRTKQDWWVTVAAIRRLRLALAQVSYEAFPFKVVTHWGWGYELCYHQVRRRSDRDRENERRRAKTATFRENRRIYMASYRNRNRLQSTHEP